MPTNVLMPQMGESVAEGTVVRWIKKVGEAVDRDEPLFEISTDKVDAEIPAPQAGVLVEILVQEGQTVAVQTVGGPPGGHCFNRPVSAEAPSRFGPRHCGQSEPTAAAEATAAATRMVPATSRFMSVSLQRRRGRAYLAAATATTCDRVRK